MLAIYALTIVNLVKILITVKVMELHTFMNMLYFCVNGDYLLLVVTRYLLIIITNVSVPVKQKQRSKPHL